MLAADQAACPLLDAARSARDPKAVAVPTVAALQTRFEIDRGIQELPPGACGNSARSPLRLLGPWSGRRKLRPGRPSDFVGADLERIRRSAASSSTAWRRAIPTSTRTWATAGSGFRCARQTRAWPVS
ncbi:hypothetical protein ACRAWD_15935 [Caulobacter segnis]